jgi:hypothetical protein
MFNIDLNNQNDKILNEVLFIKIIPKLGKSLGIILKYYK